MHSIVSSSEKVRRIYNDQHHFIQEDTSKKWSNFVVAEPSFTYNDNLFTQLTALLDVGGINHGAYVNTALHNPVIRKGIVGGDNITRIRNQKKVRHHLFLMEKVSEVYLNESSDNDCYTIITEQTYPTFTLELADVYWHLFDYFQKINTSYIFEFEHFNKSEVPSQIEINSKKYLRGH